MYKELYPIFLYLKALYTAITSILIEALLM